MTNLIAVDVTIDGRKLEYVYLGHIIPPSDLMTKELEKRIATGWKKSFERSHEAQRNICKMSESHGEEHARYKTKGLFEMDMDWICPVHIHFDAKKRNGAKARQYGTLWTALGAGVVKP